MVMKQNPIPEVYKIFDQQGFNLPPKADQFLRKISDEYSKNGFSITLTLVTLITDVVIYPLFGAIGGLLTAAAIGKKRRCTAAISISRLKPCTPKQARYIQFTILFTIGISLLIFISLLTNIFLSYFTFIPITAVRY